MKHPSLRLVKGPIVALLVLAAPTSVGAEGVSSSDRFQLWNACKPIDLVVEHLNDAAVKISLTREAITTAVRSRLRAARLYSSKTAPFLYVSVTLVRTRTTSSSISLKFNKWLPDPKLNGQVGSATTWNRHVVQQGGNADYILSAVSQLTDLFIDEYLRVNGSACSRSPIDP